jgi:hypothetical protein
MTTMATVFAVTAATLVTLWGVAHVIPTRQVLRGFEPIPIDNRRIILQEWLAEAFTMWGIAALIVSVTVSAGAGSSASHWVYRASAGLLLALAALTTVTGARTPVVWFKICPVLLTVSAILLVSASLS